MVFESITLDGVIQAPGRPDEDPRDGFAHSGWATPYADDVLAKVAAEGMATTRALLFGRRTYEDFAGFWPHQTDNPFAQVLNDTPKYVVSTTLADPLGWHTATLVSGLDAVAGLRDLPGGDIVVLGSGELVRSMAARGLVDEYVLLLHPVVLGSGRRLFADGAAPTALRLENTTVTGTGVVVATYRPAA
ncbi:deaminase [Longispora fulva]|nr:deaminase [Longispora fulva]